eukprot:CAMPEP_0116078634 /NCGR_PEP_ID=MMETSP0327-20121206/712_1 /TAXON_ID=44447 /ORGANISM="Pseudo-nitzschia delicatissima, Strain B596" /LENGTH=921 /DNA_ID=CAMNT_0003569203 /DNA_START=72 /DNA_END=2837 /DNA_ORIENTATION=+
MTIPSEEDAPSEVGQELEQKTDAGTSSPSKSKSITRSTESSLSDDRINGTDDATVESFSKAKSKSKKKKKKVSRIGDGNSPAMLASLSDDKSSNGVETKTIVSTTSSKLKKKKKKKTITNDDAESVDMVSISSKKSPQPKKKKKKKISRESNDGESPGATLESSAQSVTSSVRSKKSKSNKSPTSTKSKKNKVKNPNESEHNIPDMEGTSKSFDSMQFSNGSPRRAMSMDNGESHFSIKRTMSLDTANNQFQHMHAGRMNSNWGGRGRSHGGRGRGPPVTGRGRGRGRGPPAPWHSRSMRPPDNRMHTGEPLARSSSHERMPASRSSSHERMNHGSRNPSQEMRYVTNRSGSSRGSRSISYHDRPSYDGRSPSQERLPYGSPRSANGRGMGPPPRGRRPMSPQKESTGASSHSRGQMYLAPSRPKSILRNSSHHGMLSGSSHHQSIGTSSSHSSSHRPRVNIDLSGSRHSTRSRNRYNGQASYGSDIDSSDIESDVDDDSSFALEDPGRRSQKPPSQIDKRSYSRSLSGLGNNSSHHGLSQYKAQSQSARSLLTIERSEYQDDNKFVSALRYIHFLPPHPNEDPIKKKIRIITWCALLCDFLNALVAIITWQGQTTKCCGQSILSALGTRGDGTGDGSAWDTAIEITTYLYMLLIFLEVVPVMRDRFPFNLMNPFIGFLITFAVFFSDSIVEAASMWVFEAMAVSCEAVNYRLRSKRFAKRKARLKNTKKEIEKLRKIKRKVKNQYDNNGGKLLTRADSKQFVLDLDDSSSFAEDSSFNDDIETNNNSADLNTVTGRTQVTTVSNIGTHRETRLLRERRQLIRSQHDDEQDLRVHLIGVTCNVSLVVFSLLLIIVIAKNGGTCLVGMRFGNVFKNDQLEKCNQCVGDDGEYLMADGEACERCSYTDPLENQCYYPYGFGKF